MRLKRALRIFLVVAALATPVACGIDLLASGDGTAAAPAASDGDGQAPGADHVPDASDDGTQYRIPPTSDPISDSGLDVNNENCLAACPEGGVASCDAGWCVFDCKDDNSCADRVTCPPGIPCDVRCSGPGSCTNSVDCTAGSACRIACTGESSCDHGSVDCAGVGCKADCIGTKACHDGITCDASTCAINCIGSDSCQDFTACSGESCTIRCGDAGVNALNAQCAHRVSCDTTKLCDLGCIGDSTCRNEPVTARSAVAKVQCLGDTTCTRGAVLSGGDASIVCMGNNACGMTTYCDAGNCLSTCIKEDVTVCCKAGPGKCRVSETMCTVRNGCP